MKHLTIDSIINKRKSLKPVLQLVQDNEGRSRVTSLSQGREMSEDVVDSLIDIAREGGSLSQENKLDILQLFSNKAGVILNKSIVLSFIGIVSCPKTQELTGRLKRGQSLFILSGEIKQYQQSQPGTLPLKFNTQPPPLNDPKPSQPDLQEQTYCTVQQFEYSNPGLQLSSQYSAVNALGRIFNPKFDKSTLSRFVGEDTVLVVVREIEREAESIYSDGLSQDEKIELVSYFPVLRMLGKKLSNFVNNFGLKHFHFKDAVYRKGEKPCSVFFVVEGEVSFELVLEASESGPAAATTSTVMPNDYFGEEEILYKSTTRSHTAKVITSTCSVLELTRDKFQKLLENPEFGDLVVKTCKLKELERHRNLQKARAIVLKSASGYSEKGEPLSEEQMKSHTVNVKAENRQRFSTFRGSSNRAKIMHGHLIRDVPEISASFHFSMLKANPDHYNATKDKYRQYFLEPVVPEKKRPRDFKKLWRVLNLENVLSENDIDLGSNEGRKYFDSHRRLQLQLTETKSVRPKTSSSNYRTKIQYIAYLQQFNH